MKSCEFLGGKGRRVKAGKSKAGKVSVSSECF